MKKLTTFLSLALLVGAGLQMNAQTYGHPYQYQTNDYIPPVNVDLVNKVLAKKEQQYNRNIERVENKVKNIIKLVQILYKNKEDKITDEQAKYISAVYKYTTGLTKDQVANDSEMVTIMRTLNSIESTLYDWL